MHHIALSMPDLGRAPASLEALGAPVLPMLESYYDDLAAGWGLDNAMLAGLRRHALLYDDDGGGRLRHLHTDAFKRFFFEVVQRGGDYAGFGAANTPVRAAAQTRRHPAGTLLI